MRSMRCERGRAKDELMYPRYEHGTVAYRALRHGSDPLTARCLSVSDEIAWQPYCETSGSATW